MSSPLTGNSALPVDVTIGGQVFPIRHGFRDGIQFESMMFDGRLTDTQKVMAALLIWFPTRPDADLGLTIAALLDFYRCGKVDADTGEDGGQLYSYVHDWDAIFAAFLHEYGIDLLDEATALHWWKFRAMLMALPETCQFMRMVGYRAAEIPSGTDKDTAAHIRKMKRLYALPDGDGMARSHIRTEADYRAALADVSAAKDAGGVLD